MLAVENIGDFGKLILIRQNFTFKSLTIHIILFMWFKLRCEISKDISQMWPNSIND